MFVYFSSKCDYNAKDSMIEKYNILPLYDCLVTFKLH